MVDAPPIVKSQVYNIVEKNIDKPYSSFGNINLPTAVQ